MGVSFGRFGSMLCVVACGAWLLAVPQPSQAGPKPRREAAKPAAVSAAKPMAAPRVALAAAKPALARAKPALLAGRPALPAARSAAVVVRPLATLAKPLSVRRAAPAGPDVAGRRGGLRESMLARLRMPQAAMRAGASARAGKFAIIRAPRGMQMAAGPAPAVATRHGARVLRTAFAPTPAPGFAPLSVGQATGLKATDDPLDLVSSVALVVDQDSGETLFEKNAQAVLPIASITKLMTALVVLEAGLPGDELIEVTQEDIDTEKHSRSRLAVGARLTRTEMLQLALMASENRAAHALGRAFPGGVPAFVAAMNAQARALDMRDTLYRDPTGLSSQNQSNARDLVRLLKAAYRHALIREFSVAPELTVDAGRYPTTFRNTNRLTRDASWDIGLQKTGFIREAGNCVVMQTRVDGRSLWMVLLDAQGSLARMSDANRLRRWVGTELLRRDDTPVASGPT